MRNYAREVFWGKPPADPKERRLLNKLDGVILSYVCLSYFCNYLDRSNLANAYVSGMKEQVGFKGNDYTYAGSCFTAGYVIGQPISAVVLASNRIPPRIWFPLCVSVWGICTLGLGFVTSPQQVMAIRFVMAIFEASTFSGTHFILGSWYKDKELGKRSAVFATCAQIGSLFSGIMQGGIIQTLEGKGGRAGWSWLFVIDFAITIPIAIYGFVMFPDTPHTTKAFWLTEEERQMCINRVPKVEHVKMTPRSFLSSCKKTFSSWRYWMFSSLFMLSATSFEKTGIYSEFPLWLTSAGYTPAQRNYYPSIFIAVAILSTYLLTLMSDAVNNRFIVNPIMFLAVFISCTMLLVWDISTAAHWFAYIIAGLGYAGQASNFAWANSMTRDDDVLRSFTVFSMNLFSNLWNLWYQIVAWPVVDAPRFKKGQIATLVTGAVSVGIAAGIVYMGRRWPPSLPEPVGDYAPEDTYSEGDAEATVLPARGGGKNGAHGRAAGELEDEKTVGRL